MSESRAVVHDEVIPAKGHWARELKAGQFLRIEDIEGEQVRVEIDGIGALTNRCRVVAASQQEAA